MQTRVDASDIREELAWVNTPPEPAVYGIEFLTDSGDRGPEIRAYLLDPDGQLIEIGEATGILRLLEDG